MRLTLEYACCCCRPTPPLGFKYPDCFIWNYGYIVYPSKIKRVIQGQLPKVFLPMIGVPDGGMGGRHSLSTSPRSSAHSKDRHRVVSFRRSLLSHPLHKHITYFNTPRLKNTLTTVATQQTFPQTPTHLLQQT